MKNAVMELRWDPVLGEWIMVSSVRHVRPWLPESFCPFCPGAPETGYGWQVLVLENKYPMLTPEPPQPSSHHFYVKSKSSGGNLIIVETPQHDLDDISDLDVNSIKLVLEALKNLVEEERGKDYAKYLLWFRNKGVEIGVSLTHPHSQVYVTPFTPVKVERELTNSKRYTIESGGKCLFCNIINVEESEKKRILYSNKSWVAFMPFYAHWPFEAHIYPRRHLQLLSDLEEEELSLLALTLKVVLCGFKKLFRKPSPYIMVMHQAPLKGDYSFYHMHFEIYGVMRGENVLKYAAGMEMGGGNFTFDSVPEDNASRLRDSISTCLRS
ncbi:MAG: galactose-1-phosphate uridylyltransferase [Thermoprotei archaeon]|nr:galactose-1-phosphate uridylyltransferase [Thermoprotei archaeon]